MQFNEITEEECEVIFDNIKFSLSNDRIIISANKNFTIKNVIARISEHLPKSVSLESNKITLEYLKRKYGIVSVSGYFIDNKTISSDKCKVELKIYRG